MFIRIIKNDPEGKGNTREILSQCERVTIERKKDDSKDQVGPSVFFTLDDDKIFELTTYNHEVYIMNDEGRTIDRYTW